jgi:hypothetical protein
LTNGTGNPANHYALDIYQHNLAKELNERNTRPRQATPILREQLLSLVRCLTTKIAVLTTVPNYDHCHVFDLITYRTLLIVKFFTGDRCPDLLVLRLHDAKSIGDHSLLLDHITTKTGALKASLFTLGQYDAAICPILHIRFMLQYFDNHIANSLHQPPSQLLFRRFSQQVSGVTERPFEFSNYHLRNWCVDAAIPIFTWHSFRRGGAIDAICSTDLATVQTIIGWKTSTVAEHYIGPIAHAIRQVPSQDSQRQLVRDILDTLNAA